ncbi:hypothetical protein A0O34_14790 [Chryseobacterium glaciei]|uniref:Uncharacterized protein n=1 Tax=Chryseobacterium glaciei TaxID=1685010 RepID=A0A172XXL1_9FLAO|nr:hypothetical protein [Chryseobacterium glaciei]ANF51694.1 hypothetical protein A0O34_14790 [Chryseobacterium glaciei]
MKFLVIIILILSTSYSCNKKLSQPIIATNSSYEDDRRLLNISYAIEKENQQTIVLVNNKEYPFKKFKQLLKKDKITTFKIIKDKKEIEQLNYLYDKTKMIIIATKK